MGRLAYGDTMNNKKLKIGDLFVYNDYYMYVKGIITEIHYDTKYFTQCTFDFKIINSSNSWHPLPDFFESFSEDSIVYNNLVVKEHLSKEELLAIVL